MKKFNGFTKLSDKLKSFKTKQLFSNVLQARKRKKLSALRVKRRQRKTFETSVAKNPYLQSRVMWNDLYGSLQTKLENSYRIIFLLSVVIVIAIIGFVVIAGETKVKPLPFIVHGNEVLTVSNARSGEFEALKPQLAYYFAKLFLRAARSVSADGEVNAANKIKALSFVSGNATQVLTDFYEQNSPNTIAQNDVKNIQFSSVLRDSQHTLTIRWVENWRSVTSGELTQSIPYIAQLTYHYEPPSSNKTILSHNPLGFVLSQLAWSEDRNH